MIQDDVSLYNKLVELGKSNIKPVVWNWKADFIIADKIYPAAGVISIDKLSDFVKNNGDNIFLQLQITQSIYNNLILPNKDKIKIKLTKEQENALGNTNRVGQSYSQTFYGFLTDSGNPFVTANETGIDNKITDDLSGLMVTYFQLIDINLYEFRLYELAGCFRTTTMTQLLTGLMSYPLKNNANKGLNVEMIEANNKKEYFQVMIPQGIRLIHLPDYLQKKYGIYGTGLGCYLFLNYWFIYPLLNHQHFSTTTKTLVILRVPSREMIGNDNSYLDDGESITVFTSGDAIHLDNSERVLNNVGRGMRYAIASNIVDGFRDIDEEGSFIPEKRNLVSINTELAPNKMENIASIPERLTDNPWEHLSTITVGLASHLVVRWEYANTELLYPGMPTKILYKHHGTVQSLMGTLLKVESTTTSNVQNPTDRRYITAALLTIHCERVIDELVPE